MARRPDHPAQNLQSQHKDATKTLILEWAMHLLVAEKDANFSHESVAAAAGISARTVYRHFPSRDELVSALWQSFQIEYHNTLPQSEDELLHKVGELYRSFDRYEPLVRAQIASHAQSEQKSLESEQAHQAIEVCLGNLISGMDDEHRGQVVGAFQSLYSPQAWLVMRDSGHLSGSQAAKAAQWAMAALLEALRPQANMKSMTTSQPEQAGRVQAFDRPQTPAPEAKEPMAGESSAKWKAVYNNPVVAKLKKFMPKE